jgi:rRNA maturation RNase YbeY
LIICFVDIEKYCQEKEISFEKEFYKVFSHGILHLLGYKHGKEMFQIQKEVSLEIAE